MARKLLKYRGKEKNKMSEIDAIIAYEQGELDEAETIALFQKLINSGLAWNLQGHYGRTAKALIEAGLIS